MNQYDDTDTSAAVVADLAERATVAENAIEVFEVGDVEFTRLLRREGDRTVERILDPRDYGAAPATRTGSVALHTIPSFIAYLRRHQGPGTEVWVDRRNAAFVAVLDDHGERGEDQTPAEAPAGWGDHRATCILRPSNDLNKWLAGDNKLMSQVDFADFIETVMHTIADPPAADLYEIAQTLQGNRSVVWKSGQRQADGQVQFRYEEQLDGRAGPSGDLEIPTVITIALELYEGTEPVHVLANFRWRLNEGRVLLGYRLQQLDVALREAIDAEIERVEAFTGRDTLLGTPRAQRTIPTFVR